MIRATVSGSFHRFMRQIADDVEALTDAGVQVLSPSDPRVVDAFGPFLFVASDPIRTIRLIQDRHHAAIRASDFLWLVCPDGYVGSSAAMEISKADECGIPVYTTDAPTDLTMRAYVRTVHSMAEALAEASSTQLRARRGAPEDGLLLAPEFAADLATQTLDDLRLRLLGRDRSYAIDDPAVRHSARRIRSLLSGL